MKLATKVVLIAIGCLIPMVPAYGQVRIQACLISKDASKPWQSKEAQEGFVSFKNRFERQYGVTITLLGCNPEMIEQKDYEYKVQILEGKGDFEKKVKSADHPEIAPGLYIIGLREKDAVSVSYHYAKGDAKANHKRVENVLGDAIFDSITGDLAGQEKAILMDAAGYGDKTPEEIADQAPNRIAKAQRRINEWLEGRKDHKEPAALASTDP